MSNRMQLSSGERSCFRGLKRRYLRRLKVRRCASGASSESALEGNQVRPTRIFSGSRVSKSQLLPRLCVFLKIEMISSMSLSSRVQMPLRNHCGTLRTNLGTRQTLRGDVSRIG
jgi:hypothetical protein